MADRIVVVSTTLSSSDIWSDGETRSTGIQVEVLRSLEELKARSAAGPLFVLAGEDPVLLRYQLMEHFGLLDRYPLQSGITNRGRSK